MGRSGSEAVYSSGLALGTKGRNISTATSIIISTIARATTGPCLRVARLQRSTVQSFTVRQCMMYMAMKHRVDAGSSLREDLDLRTAVTLRLLV